jgi:NAD(P)-dependent dehydrogenase (short-subunit alcohol dehydrogenase family)
MGNNGDFLENKVAIITGAGSGIGLETALLFARNKAKVALFGLTKQKLDAVKQEIEAAGGQALSVSVDITKEDKVIEACRQVVEAYGKIDILINNAGVFMAGNVEETSLSDWNRIMDINLTGMFLCMKHVVPYMKKNNGGAIVNISSEAGLVGMKGQVVYNVSKAAAISLTKSSAVDYALDNIRVNCVCPGRVVTPLVEEIIKSSPDPKKAFEDLSYDRPMMKMGDPKEIAFACLMMSCDNIKYATGAVLTIDGGQTAR